MLLSWKQTRAEAPRADKKIGLRPRFSPIRASPSDLASRCVRLSRWRETIGDLTHATGRYCPAQGVPTADAKSKATHRGADQDGSASPPSVRGRNHVRNGDLFCCLATGRGQTNLVQTCQHVTRSVALPGGGAPSTSPARLQILLRCRRLRLATLVRMVPVDMAGSDIWCVPDSVHWIHRACFAGDTPDGHVTPHRADAGKLGPHRRRGAQQVRDPSMSRHNSHQLRVNWPTQRPADKEDL